MITDTVSSTTSSTLGSALTSSGTSALGKDDFLKLLTAQLQHQDPLEPIQNEAFVAQLAQFSSLEQMQNMNTSLATSILVNQSVNNSLSTSLIGREVEARGDQISHAAGGTDNLAFDLGAAADVKVEVVDSNGKVVATLKPGHLESGRQTVNWDGKCSDGSSAAAGEYHFKVTATDAKGGAVSVDTVVQGRVTGVKFDGGATYLLVNGRKISLSDVIQIVEVPQAKS